MTKLINVFTKLSIVVFLSMAFSSAYAKNYSAQDIYGRPISFSIPSNKWIIINYWATWCSACVEEIPELNKLATTLANKPAVFFAVNYEGLPSERLREFAARYGMQFPIMRTNPIANLVNSDDFSSVPVTVIISPQGQVKMLQGEQSVSDILSAIS